MVRSRPIQQKVEREGGEGLPGDETEKVRQSAASKKETSNAEPGDLNDEGNAVEP